MLIGLKRLITHNVCYRWMAIVGLACVFVAFIGAWDGWVRFGGEGEMIVPAGVWAGVGGGDEFYLNRSQPVEIRLGSFPASDLWGCT